MNEMAGIILSEGTDDHQLGVLTSLRAISSMPMASRYRLIDFILSDMVNSGIRNVGVATRYNYSSLMDHLGSGKEWDLDRKNRGLYILPPNIGRESVNNENAGDIDVLHGIGSFLRKTKPDYFVISKGSAIFNATFNDALDYHISKGADITIIYNDEKENKECLKYHNVLTVNDDGRVVDIMKNHPNPKSSFVSMDIFIIERSLLINLVEDCVAHGEHDISLDILVKNINKLNIYGYKFGGYVGRVDSIDSYYKTNMQILKSDIRKEIFASKNKIYTKVRNQTPTHYNDGCSVSNSLVADGCVINGSVENSIIFRGVKIGKGATVKNSIIMQDGIIQDGCYVENVVLDKNVKVLAGKTIMGQPSYPFVVAKGTTI